MNEQTRSVMTQLKDFQRDTVDYVFDRLYGADDAVRRFLVADEVGLGKTLVARGVIAMALEHLAPTTKGPPQNKSRGVVWWCGDHRDGVGGVFGDDSAASG